MFVLQKIVVSDSAVLFAGFRGFLSPAAFAFPVDIFSKQKQKILILKLIRA